MVTHFIVLCSIHIKQKKSFFYISTKSRHWASRIVYVLISKCLKAGARHGEPRIFPLSKWQIEQNSEVVQYQVCMPPSSQTLRKQTKASKHLGRLCLISYDSVNFLWWLWIIIYFWKLMFHLYMVCRKLLFTSENLTCVCESHKADVNSTCSSSIQFIIGCFAHMCLCMCGAVV